MAEFVPKIPRKIVGDGYEVTKRYRFYSRRYNRWLTIPAGFYSDGATNAPDIVSDAWIVHDHICRYGVWDDGTLIDNWTASTVLADILWNEAKVIAGMGLRWEGFIRRCRSVSWWFATYFFGGGAARKNGMRQVRDGIR